MNRQHTVTDGHELLPYLLEVLGLKRAAAKRLLRFGAVLVNGVAVRQFDQALAPGDRVLVGDLRSAVAADHLQRAAILPVYEDPALIVVEKPSGLLTVATERETLDTLFVRLNQFLRDRNPHQTERALVTHRLDQETSGLVLFAKSEAARRTLQANWSSVKKTYLAVVRGRPACDSGTLSSYLTEDPRSLRVTASTRPRPGARLATTHYQVRKATGNLSLLEVQLETGRKHQIRVHLASLGCPVVGDRRYGTRAAAGQRLALHASGLEFAHPVTGAPLCLTSPLPKALRALVSCNGGR